MNSYIIYLILPYTILIIAFIIGYKKTPIFTPSELKSNKLISIIVACKNEEQNVEKLLSSITHQSYQNLEVVIIDDHSTDNTYQILTHWASQQSFKTVIVKNSGKGKKQAILQAIELSKGEVIFTTDADCILHPNHIATLASYYDKENPDMLLAIVRMESSKKTPISLFDRLEFASLIASSIGATGIKKSIMCNAANLSYKREEVIKHTKNIKINIPSGDDMFLLHSFKKEGKKIRYIINPETIVATKATNSILDFIKQRTRWGGKTPHYTDLFTKTVAVIIFATSLSIALSPLFPNPGYSFTTLFITKLIVDTLLLYPYLVQTKQKDLLIYIPLFSFVYPLYIIVVAVIGVINSTVKNLKKE